MKKLLSTKNKAQERIDDENVKLRAELELKNKELEYWKAKYVAATTGAGKSNSSKQRNPWLDNMESLLHSKPDYVKYLVSCGKISMNDTDKDNKTLLIIAAEEGRYDIVQLCVNLGANIDFKDDFGRTAIDRARDGAWYHCEELLLFSQLSANVSDRVQNTAFSMNKQNGIVENIINEMNNVIKDTNEKDKFVQTLTKILCNIINKTLSFSDDLLNLCWIYGCNSCNSTMSDDLSQTLLSTCNNIIVNGNKKDWHYFKTFILASNVCTVCCKFYF